MSEHFFWRFLVLSICWSGWILDEHNIDVISTPPSNVWFCSLMHCCQDQSCYEQFGCESERQTRGVVEHCCGMGSGCVHVYMPLSFTHYVSVLVPAHAFVVKEVSPTLPCFSAIMSIDNSCCQFPSLSLSLFLFISLSLFSALVVQTQFYNLSFASESPSVQCCCCCPAFDHRRHIYILVRICIYLFIHLFF